MPLRLSALRLSFMRFCLLLASITMATAAFAQDTVMIAHSSGETRVPVNPKRVVVLDWAVLDTMEALGVEAAGIPSTKAPQILERYRADGYIKAGTLFEPDLEALKNARPDLIILGRRAQPQYETVSRFGTTIDLTPNPRDLLGSVVRNTRILGEIFGRQEQAEALVRRLQDSVSRLNGLTADRGTGLLVLTTGGRMAAFGVGTRFGMIHDVFGITPAADNLKSGRHGHAVSFEFLLQANPDWLFVMDRDAAIGRDGIAARALMDNELVKATNAGAKNQIVYLDPVNWYLLDNSGVRVIQQSVDQLIELFGAQP